ncbi:MAG: AAA family ATPase [Nanoarchaeota archaeon]|nr:AAA family ATPase [Nanoarchaeota archaeon]
MIIVICGTIASGKGRAAELIRDKGFEHHSYSLEIRAIAKERGIKINRPNLSKLGAQLKKERPGKSTLTDKLLEKVDKDPKKNYVIEGLRDIEAVVALREYEKRKKVKIIIIGVDAPQKLRFERLKGRGRHGDPKTFAEFKEIDDREFKGGKGQDVGAVVKMAKYVIDNSGTEKELKKKVDEVLKKIKAKKK